MYLECCFVYRKHPININYDHHQHVMVSSFANPINFSLVELKNQSSRSIPLNK